MFFAFKLCLRKKNDSDVNDVSVFLTFIGGRTLGTKRKVDADEESPSKVHHSFCSNSKYQNTHLPVLPVVSESDVNSLLKAESLYQNEEIEPVMFTQSNFLTFCSKSKECGLLDITRFNVFPKMLDGMPSSRSEELIALFDSFISCKICKPEKLLSNNILNDQTGRNDDYDNDLPFKSFSENIPSQKNSKKSANVFPCYNKSERGDCRFLVYIDDYLEYGQSIELNLGPKIEESSDNGSYDPHVDPTAFSSKRNIQQRERLLSLVSSLSMKELQEVVIPLHAAFQSLKLNLKSFLDKKDEIVNILSPQKMLEHLIIFRRFSWVAGILKSQIEFLLRNDSKLSSINPEWDHTEQKNISKCISDMSWHSLDQGEVEFVSEYSDGFLFHGFQDEFSEEILTLLSSKKLVMNPFEERFWCAISSNLLFNLLDTVSSYLIMTTHETHSSQNELFEIIIHHTNNALRTFEDGCNLPGNLTVANKRFLEQVAFESSKSSDSTLQNFFEMNNENTQESEDTPIGNLEESYVFCETGTRRQSIANALKASVSVDEIWYITHQILFVVHHVTTCGMIKWLKAPPDFHNVSMYSITRLRNALVSIEPKRFNLFQKIAIHSICLPTTVPVLKSSLFPIKEFIQNVSTSSSKSTPKTLLIFLQTLWPALSAKGWRISGHSPSRISYHLTTSVKNRSNDDSISPFVEMKEHKHDRHTKDVMETRVIQMPRILKRILVSAIPPLTTQEARMMSQNEDGLKYSVNKVLQNYTNSVLLQYHENDETSSKTTLLTIESVEKLFNETVLNFMFESEIDFYKEDLAKRRKSDFLTCEFFLRMAVMLPYNLKRAGIRKGDIGAIILVVEDILKYLAIQAHQNFQMSILFSSNNDNKECTTPDLSSKDSFVNTRDRHMKAMEHSNELKQSKANHGIEFHHHSDLIKYLFDSGFVEENSDLKEHIDNYYATIEKHEFIK